MLLHVVTPTLAVDTAVHRRSCRHIWQLVNVMANVAVLILPNLNHSDLTFFQPERTRVKYLPPAGWIKRRPIKNDRWT
jgi:hypothetical protein